METLNLREAQFLSLDQITGLFAFYFRLSKRLVWSKTKLTAELLSVIDHLRRLAISQSYALRARTIAHSSAVLPRAPALAGPLLCRHTVAV